MAEDTQTGAGLGETIGNAGTAVKDGVVGGLRGLHEIEMEVVELMRDTVSHSVQATGAVVKEGVTVVSGVLKGTIQATEEVGSGIITGTKMSPWGSLPACARSEAMS